MLSFAQQNYVDIPRTRISMIKPAGYVPLKTTSGFVKGSETIMIMDMVGGNFYTNARQEYFDNMDKQVKVYKHIDTTLQGYPAKYLITNSSFPGHNGLMVIFGDTTFSVLILALYDIANQEGYQSLFNTFFSLNYDKTKIIDPFQGIYFTTDTSKTTYRFHQFAAGIYIYKDPALGNIPGGTMAFVSQIPNDGSMPIEMISEMVFAEGRKNGTYGFMTESKSKSTASGITTYMIAGQCFTDDGKKVFAQKIIIKDDVAITVIAQCKINDAGELLQLQAFIDGVSYQEPAN